MQRGLRVCKGSREMWTEYFRMELLYALRLRERRRVLGIDDSGACLCVSWEWGAQGWGVGWWVVGEVKARGAGASWGFTAYPELIPNR